MPLAAAAATAAAATTTTAAAAAAGICSSGGLRAFGFLQQIAGQQASPAAAAAAAAAPAAPVPSLCMFWAACTSGKLVGFFLPRRSCSRSPPFPSRPLNTASQLTLGGPQGAPWGSSWGALGGP